MSKFDIDVELSPAEEKSLDALFMSESIQVLLKFLKEVKSTRTESALEKLVDDAEGGQREYLKSVGIGEIITLIEMNIDTIKESRQK